MSPSFLLLLCFFMLTMLPVDSRLLRMERANQHFRDDDSWPSLTGMMMNVFKNKFNNHPGYSHGRPAEGHLVRHNGKVVEWKPGQNLDEMHAATHGDPRHKQQKNPMGETAFDFGAYMKRMSSKFGGFEFLSKSDEERWGKSWAKDTLTQTVPGTVAIADMAGDSFTVHYYMRGQYGQMNLAHKKVTLDGEEFSADKLYEQHVSVDEFVNAAEQSVADALQDTGLNAKQLKIYQTGKMRADALKWMDMMHAMQQESSALSNAKQEWINKYKRISQSKMNL